MIAFRFNASDASFAENIS